LKLTVLGCSGAELPGHRPPGYLLDDEILVDAGTVTSVLPEAAQEKIRHILISHAHLDHVRGIAALADNLILREMAHAVRLHGIAPVLDSIRKHLLNNDVWPDFTTIPDVKRPVMTYEELASGEERRIDGFRIRAVEVNHSVPAAGYIIEKNDRVLVYTGDTGPTDAIWGQTGKIDFLVVEVSFPSRMESMARMTGHLTPDLLRAELGKIAEPPARVMITHMKPQYREELAGELEGLGVPGLAILQEGDVFEW